MQTGNWRTLFRGFALGAIPKWHQNIYSTLDLSALFWVYLSLHPEKMLAAIPSNRVSSTSQLGASRCFTRLEVHFRRLDLKFKKLETLIKHRNKTRMEVSGSKPRNFYFGSFFHIQCHESWIRFYTTKNVQLQLFSVHFSASDPLMRLQHMSMWAPSAKGTCCCPAMFIDFQGATMKAWQQIMCIEFDFQWILWFSYLEEKADSGTIATAGFKSW